MFKSRKLCQNFSLKMGMSCHERGKMYTTSEGEVHLLYILFRTALCAGARLVGAVLCVYPVTILIRKIF